MVMLVYPYYFDGTDEILMDETLFVLWIPESRYAKTWRA